jgi:hypothetical protein
VTVLIEIAAIEPPKEGKKVAKVITTTGARLEIWPNKLAGLKTGGRYAVELATREWEGNTIHKIAKIVPADQAGAQEPKSEAPGPANSVAPFVSSEASFVATVLAAYVAAGKIADKAELWQTTLMLRGLWNAAFVNNSPAAQRQTERNTG